MDKKYSTHLREDICLTKMKSSGYIINIKKNQLKLLFSYDVLAAIKHNNITYHVSKEEISSKTTSMHISSFVENDECNIVTHKELVSILKRRLGKEFSRYDT